MITILEKQQIVNLINEIISAVILRETNLQFEYEKWIDDCIDQSIFTLEGEPPVNSKFNNRNDLVTAIHRDANLYKDFIVKFLQTHHKIATFEHILKDVQRTVKDFEQRLKNYDAL